MQKPEAIQRLYKVFSRYPARPDMPRCEHCAPTEEIERLCSVPLADLTAEDLYYYVLHAIGTVGEVVDFKHFLPRVFELFLWADDGSNDLEIVTGKLNDGNWRHWPTNEQEATSAFLFDWWKNCLSRDQVEFEAESLLCAIAQAEDDLCQFLAHWRQCGGPNAVLHLAKMLNWSCDVLATGQPLPSPWWAEREPQMSQVRDWLLSPLTGKALDAACSTYAKKPFACQLREAAQQFRQIRHALSGRSE